MQQLKKIVAIGPESTGKSVLCERLAAHYNTLWVPEYARSYLEANGTDYNYEDVLKIAKGQLSSENVYAVKAAEQSTGNTPLLFIDTDLYVIKVWCEFVFGKCDNNILSGIATRKYDLYLLCDIDLPWVKDKLREYPDIRRREKLYRYYQDAMINQPVPWVDINGSYEERFQKAVEAVDKLFG